MRIGRATWRRAWSTSTAERLVPCVFVFFFQAEDGIRYLTVTGVQTCALPISHPRGRRRANDVDALACFRCCTALERRRHGEDGIDATCGALETSLIFEVPCNDRDAARREGCGAGRVGLPRQRANRVPAGEQFAHQMAALLPCRAGHEHVQLPGHVIFPFSKCSFILEAAARP